MGLFGGGKKRRSKRKEKRKERRSKRKARRAKRARGRRKALRKFGAKLQDGFKTVGQIGNKVADGYVASFAGGDEMGDPGIGSTSKFGELSSAFGYNDMAQVVGASIGMAEQVSQLKPVQKKSNSIFNAEYTEDTKKIKDTL